MGAPASGSDGRFGTIVVVSAPPADVDLASGLLWGAGVLGIEERPLADGTVEVRAGLAPDSDAAAVVAAVAGRWPVEVEVLEDDAWLDAWQEHAAPVAVGERLLVVPTWVLSPSAAAAAEADAARRVAVALPPHRAFGSGAHPTTRLALELIEHLVHPGATVLDVGCGSGLLAVAAARLGAGSVVAVDVDPEAVRATAATAEANGVAGVVDVSATPVAEVRGRFDVVVANIVLPVLRELLPAMALRTADDGTLVLTGVLDAQVSELVAACAASGMDARPVASIEGWSSVRVG